MKKLTEIEKAYIAGILDGEGSVGIDRSKSRSNVYDYNFKIRVMISNSYFPLICWLKEITGIGCAWKSNENSHNPKWKPIHRWQVVSEEARKFLLEIYPYTQIKKEIIDLVLRLPEIGRRGRARSIDEYGKQSSLHVIAKNMNVRGIVVNSN